MACRTLSLVFRATLNRRTVLLPIPVADSSRRRRGFFEYYQINRGNEDNQADESEPSDENELKSESFHSVFGFIWAVAEKTGWSQDAILDTPFNQLLIMMADAPRLAKKKKEHKKLTTDAELEAFFGTKIKT